MGDRTFWYESCTQCGKEIEVDAPSSLIWSCHCDACEWSDGREYFEVGENTIILCTKQEFEEKYGRRL